MRGLIAELISSRHQVTVVDMEAGLEHLSRAGGTLRHIDQLLIVTDLDRKAVETARKTRMLAQELGIARVGLIGNKVRDDTDKQDLQRFCTEEGIELIAALPDDEQVRQADRRGVALYEFAPDSATVQALAQVVNQLEKKFDMLPAVEKPIAPSPTNSSPETKKRFPECN